MEEDETRMALLNVSSNLRRISQWAYEYPNETRIRNVETFLKDTEKFIPEIDAEKVPPQLKNRYQRFLRDFPQLKERWKTAHTNHFRRLVWAEEMLTWSCLLD